MTKKKEIRRFGTIAFLFFGVLCGLAVLRKKEVLPWFFGCLSIAGLSLLVFSVQLRRVYEGWVKTGHFIGKVATSIMLGLAYYLVITPAGLLKKIFSGSPLPLRPDRNVQSYWRDRAKLEVSDRERFEKRY